MKYFTFLGVGPNDEGYKEIIYQFDELEECEENIVISCFVQEAIIKANQGVIDAVYIFATKESKEKYGSSFEAMLLKNNIFLNDIHFIDITKDEGFNGFVSKMENYLRDAQEFMIDVTNSFRDIPMRFLMSITYIEKATNAVLKNLYYGKIHPKEGQTHLEGSVVDLIRDFRMQELSYELMHFNSTLRIANPNVFNNYDSDLKEYIQCLNGLNKVIEFCEFNKSLQAIRNIVEQSSRILNKSKDGKYEVLVPFVRSIKEKFVDVNKQAILELKQEKLIRILLEHGLYQIAITFTDQYFREKLIRLLVDPDNSKFQIKEYVKSINKEESNNFVFNLSQTILSEIRSSNKGDYIGDNIRKILENNSSNLDKIKKCAMSNDIDIFYNEVRNKINHGAVIEKDSDSLKDAILSIFSAVSV